MHENQSGKECYTNGDEYDRPKELINNNNNILCPNYKCKLIYKPLETRPEVPHLPNPIFTYLYLPC